MALRDDSLADEDRLALRALAAGVLAMISAQAAGGVQLDALAERTRAVHAAMTGR